MSKAATQRVAVGSKLILSPQDCGVLFVLVKQQKGSRLGQGSSQRDCLLQGFGNVLIWTEIV